MADAAAANERVIDPVVLTAELIRCASVTPENAGALEVVEGPLAEAGFHCERIRRGNTDNLYARWGTGGPVFAFAGHVDVVPPGPESAWTHAPFAAIEDDGILWGRGAVDMKSGVAAFVAAAVQFVRDHAPDGSISLLITCDEEGDATDGTLAILDWMDERGECADFCLVGEPTSVSSLGDTLKIGRRGSMTGHLTVRGQQGHSAYPERAVNPLPVLAAICARLSAEQLDSGSAHFQPSTLAVTTIDVGNSANNVIPAEGHAVFNIRFNDLHNAEKLQTRLAKIICDEANGTSCQVHLRWSVSGESFLTEPGMLTSLVAEAIEASVGAPPQMNTDGGTSDARFIKDLCPVVEFGLVGKGMHQVDECVPVADVGRLSTLYTDILARFFQQVRPANG